MNHKPGKREEAKNTVKHTIPGGSAVGAGLHSLLRRGETAYGKDTARPLAGFKGLRLTAGRRHTRVCIGLGRVHVQLSGAYRALGGGKVGNCSALETGAGVWGTS